MVLRRIHPNSHIVTKGNKILYKGVELDEIQKVDGNLILVNIGRNTFKKFKMSTFRRWMKIKKIELRVSYNTYDDDDDKWYPHFIKKFYFTPVQFLKYITEYNHAVPYLNELCAIGELGHSCYDFKKVKIEFYNRDKKKMGLDKFIVDYFDNNVF